MKIYKMAKDFVLETNGSMTANNPKAKLYQGILKGGMGCFLMLRSVENVPLFGGGSEECVLLGVAALIARVVMLLVSGLGQLLVFHQNRKPH